MKSEYDYSRLHGYIEARYIPGAMDVTGRPLSEDEMEVLFSAIFHQHIVIKEMSKQRRLFDQDCLAAINRFNDTCHQFGIGGCVDLMVLTMSGVVVTIGLLTNLMLNELLDCLTEKTRVCMEIDSNVSVLDDFMTPLVSLHHIMCTEANKIVQYSPAEVQNRDGRLYFKRKNVLRQWMGNRVQGYFDNESEEGEQRGVCKTVVEVFEKWSQQLNARYDDYDDSADNVVLDFVRGSIQLVQLALGTMKYATDTDTRIDMVEKMVGSHLLLNLFNAGERITLKHPQCFGMRSTIQDIGEEVMVSIADIVIGEDLSMLFPQRIQRGMDVEETTDDLEDDNNTRSANDDMAKHQPSNEPVLNGPTDAPWPDSSESDRSVVSVASRFSEIDNKEATIEYLCDRWDYFCRVCTEFEYAVGLCYSCGVLGEKKPFEVREECDDCVNRTYPVTGEEEGWGEKDDAGGVEYDTGGVKLGRVEDDVEEVDVEEVDDEGILV